VKENYKKLTGVSSDIQTKKKKIQVTAMRKDSQIYIGRNAQAIVPEVRHQFNHVMALYFTVCFHHIVLLT